MSKRIGIASEGPTDYLVIKTIIDRITGEDNQYLPLQPEPDMAGRYGNGWKVIFEMLFLNNVDKKYEGENLCFQ